MSLILNMVRILITGCISIDISICISSICNSDYLSASRKRPTGSRVLVAPASS